MADNVYDDMSAEAVTGLLERARWRTSSYSGALGNCVEVAELGSREIAIRNSRRPSGVKLIFGRAELVAFLHGAKIGEFDQ